jgi:hypothetical protein
MKLRAPQTSEQFRDQLQQLFPGFVYKVDEEKFTYHAVLMDFTPFFGRHVSEFTEKQLKALAGIVNLAAESSGELANAFDTCFFEALRRPHAAKALQPFLSAKARNLSHA